MLRLASYVNKTLKSEFIACFKDGLVSAGAHTNVWLDGTVT